MALKIPVFKQVDSAHLSELQRDLKKLVSTDSVASILNSYLARIEQTDVLDMHELQILLEWHSKIAAPDMKTVKSYVNKEINRNPEAFNLVANHFGALRHSDVVRLLVGLPFISERLSESQKNAFEVFLSGAIAPEKVRGTDAISYIENLCLVESRAFSEGQIGQAEQFLFTTDFSEIFESRFERLVGFLNQCRVDSPGVISKILDLQLGKLITANEAEVTAKAYNSKLGYSKYKAFVEANANRFPPSNLPNYQRLLRLVSRFEEAVDILSEHELIRGSFWRSVIDQVDGVKFQRGSFSDYRVAVAFFVGDYVFCDFGPTGNKVHVYDKRNFFENIENSKNWKRKELLTDGLSTSWYSHIGDWQSLTRKLISEAKRNG